MRRAWGLAAVGGVVAVLGGCGTAAVLGSADVSSSQTKESVEDRVNSFAALLTVASTRQVTEDEILRAGVGRDTPGVREYLDGLTRVYSREHGWKAGEARTTSHIKKKTMNGPDGDVTVKVNFVIENASKDEYASEPHTMRLERLASAWVIASDELGPEVTGEVSQDAPLPPTSSEDPVATTG